MTLDLFGQVSTSDDGQRAENDFYETPAWMTYSLLHFHSAIRRTRVLEPCSGRDAISDVLVEYGCTVYTNDIDDRHPSQTHEDATVRSYWKAAPVVQWIVTNPPFSAAFELVQYAKDHAMVGVALLLRKSFLEPTAERGGWLNVNPPTRVIGLPRYNFRGEGSGDSVSCDWFIWERQPDRSLKPFEIDHLAKGRRTA
jgi:hypothetical protein